MMFYRAAFRSRCVSFYRRYPNPEKALFLRYFKDDIARKDEVLGDPSTCGTQLVSAVLAVLHTMVELGWDKFIDFVQCF